MYSVRAFLFFYVFYVSLDFILSYLVNFSNVPYSAVTIKKAVYDYLGQIRFFVQSYREKYDESSSLKHNTLRATKMKLFAF